MSGSRRVSDTGIAYTSAQCRVRGRGVRTQLQVRRRTDLVRQYGFCATAVGAAHLEFPWVDGHDLPRQVSTLSTVLRAKHAAPHQLRKGASYPSPSSSATKSTTVPSGKIPRCPASLHVLGGYKSSKRRILEDSTVLRLRPFWRLIPAPLKCHSVGRGTSVPTGSTGACRRTDCASRREPAAIRT